MASININNLVSHCMENNVLNPESFQAILRRITITAVRPRPAPSSSSTSSSPVVATGAVTTTTTATASPTTATATASGLPSYEEAIASETEVVAPPPPSPPSSPSPSPSPPPPLHLRSEINSLEKHRKANAKAAVTTTTIAIAASGAGARAAPTVQKIIDKNIDSSYVKVNTCGFKNIKNIKNLKNRFLQTLPTSLSDRNRRADIFVSNYNKRMSPQLLIDLKTANVKLKDYNDMVTKKKPLGFSNNLQWVSLCKELMIVANTGLTVHINGSSLSKKIKDKMIKQLTENTAYTLVFTGTSTTFYSENPYKKNHFFNAKGNFTADIDVAITFKSDFRENILSIMPRENHLSINISLRARQISMADTYKILGLQKFYLKWGPYEYFSPHKNTMTDLLKNSILHRNVNIIMLKIEDTPTHNSLCDYRFYYPVPVVAALAPAVAAASKAASGGSKKKRTVTIKSDTNA